MLRFDDDEDSYKLEENTCDFHSTDRRLQIKQNVWPLTTPRT